MRNILVILVITCSLTLSFAQTRVISGIVKGNREPMPGVNVVLKGTPRGTVTDADGKFNIVVPSNETVTLAFSAIGPYKELRIPPNRDFVRVHFKIDLGNHAIYGLLGAGISWRSKQDSHPLLSASVGYRYLYSTWGVGLEANYLSTKLFDLDFNQLGIPILGYYRVNRLIIAQAGGGYYWTLRERQFNSNFKLLFGLLYDKRHIAFGLRYYAGLLEPINGERGLLQNLNGYITFRFK